MAKARPGLLWFSLIVGVAVALMGVISTPLHLMASSDATRAIVIGVALVLLSSATLLGSDRPQLARALGIAGFIVAVVSLLLAV